MDPSDRSIPINVSADQNLPPNFWNVMRKSKPDANTPKAADQKRNSKGKSLYCCKTCIPIYQSNHRGNAAQHVRSHHPIMSSKSTSQQSITSMFGAGISPSTLRSSFNQQGYKEAIIGLITRRRVPLSVVEWSELKQLALACNPAIEDLLITSRRSITRVIVANYELYAGQLKDSLATAISPIHVSSDLWTSPHHHALLAVCAQWVDKDYQLRKALIGLPECRNNHSGEQQATLILRVLEGFDIQSRIGWHTSDNATSNDTCLKALSEKLAAKHKINFDPEKRRIRCIAHIINLSLQACLTASSQEALKAALKSAGDTNGENLLTQFSEALASRQRLEASLTTRSRGEPEPKRRRRGSQASQASALEDFEGVQGLIPLRKLHGIALWLRNSAIHANLWDDAVGLRLGIDNATRWSSWYTLISNALKKKKEINQFMNDHEAAIGEDRFIASDWDFLAKAHAFLEPFASSTLYAEGAKSSISQSLALMDALLLHYEEARVRR